MQKTLAAFAVVALVGAASLVAAGAEPTVLTADNFASKTAEGNWFIKFYAPWCGHCKRLAPTWDRLADEKPSDNINIGKIDCTAHQSVCSSNGVRGYPTLKLFKNGGDGEKYQGGRDYDTLSNWVLGKVGGAAPNSDL